MVHAYTNGNFVADDQTTIKPKILFVGSDIDFSEHSFGAVKVEFPSFEIVRLTGLSDVTLYSQFNDQIAMVILAQSNAPHLIEAFDACQSACKSARVVLAYQDTDLASDVLKQLVPDYGLQELSFLPMNRPIDSWLAIVRLVLQQDTYVPTELMENLPYQTHQRTLQSSTPCAATMPRPAPSDEGGLLTNRETEVLALVAKGQQNKTIANLLDVSEHTVKLHIHNVIRKLGVSNRTAAAAWYHAELQPDPGESPGHSPHG